MVFSCMPYVILDPNFCKGLSVLNNQSCLSHVRQDGPYLCHNHVHSLQPLLSSCPLDCAYKIVLHTQPLGDRKLLKQVLLLSLQS